MSFKPSGTSIENSTSNSSFGANCLTFNMPLPSSKIMLSLLPFLIFAISFDAAVRILVSLGMLPSAFGIVSAAITFIVRFLIKSVLDGFFNLKLIFVACFSMDTSWLNPKSLKAGPIDSGIFLF